MVPFLFSLCIGSVRGMQFGSIQAPAEKEQRNFLHEKSREERLTCDRKVRGLLAITVGVAKLAKAGYLSITIDNGINSVDNGAQGEIVIVAEATIGIYLIDYGVCMLLKYIDW